MKLQDKTYDLLKNIALILPVIITFIVAIMKIWNIPYQTQVELTLLAFEALIAGIVKVANKVYLKNKKKGK